MSPVDHAPARSSESELPAAPTVLGGWGRGPGAPMMLFSPGDRESARSALAQARTPRPEHRGFNGAIARGMGRSYGDAAQLQRGFAIGTRALGGLELDVANQAVTVGAGVTIGELLTVLVPAGWIVPVVPGTQHVSVGGAIASDVHGKNHETEGTFARAVQALGLLTGTGELVELEPDDVVFQATVGGMGLTGVIIWARIAVRRVGGSTMAVASDRVDDLDAALEALSVPGGAHRVAWLDLLGPRPARGIVTRAEYLDAALAGRAAEVAGPARARVPERWPGGVLRASLVRAFNELRFRRAPRRARDQIETIGAHLFPLDALDGWPRLYGRGGFVQYQLVVPRNATRTLEAVIASLRRRHVPCFLAVLKGLGPAGPAPLSFPLAGWTLALDLPGAAPGLRAALDELDRLVAEAGGRVYLTKDARLRAEMVQAMYPRLAEWQDVRARVDPDCMWRSDLALRLGLVEADPR